MSTVIICGIILGDLVWLGWFIYQAGRHRGKMEATAKFINLLQ